MANTMSTTLSNIENRLLTLERKISGFNKAFSSFETRIDSMDNNLNELVALTKEQFSDLFSQVKTAGELLDSITKEFYDEIEEEDNVSDNLIYPEDEDPEWVNTDNETEVPLDEPLDESDVPVLPPPLDLEDKEFDQFFPEQEEEDGEQDGE